VITGQSQTSGTTLFLSTAVEHSFMKAHMVVVYCVTTGTGVQLHKVSKLNNAIRRYSLCGMWRHKRRNQIWSFSETDESIWIGGGVSSVHYWQSRSADQRAAIVLSLASMLIKAWKCGYKAGRSGEKGVTHEIHCTKHTSHCPNNGFFFLS